MDKPIHPKRIKKWQKLFNAEGIQVEVLSYRVIAGRYEFTTFYHNGTKNIFTNHMYDVHDYNDEENPYPILYRKKPKIEKEI